MRLKRTGSAEKRQHEYLAYRCSKCKEPLTTETARRNGHRKTGWSACCRACDRADVAARRAADPDRARGRDRAWYKANAARVLAAKAAWNKANPGKRLAVHRRYRAANPHYCVRHAQIRRARLRGVAHDLTIAQWLATLEYFDNRCAYCLRANVPLEQDHVVAISRGGDHTEANVVPACLPCNRSKKDRLVFAMLGALAA
jgi:5-methylcytosine-specific restriction endonuclease McrA